MSVLHLNPEQCVGCGLCVRACAAGALRLEGGKAVLDESACALCSLCIDACPTGAITPAAAARSGETGDWSGVWVFAEPQGSAPAPVALELLTRARALADDLGQPLTAVFPCGDAAGCALLAQYGADQILHCTDAALERPDEELLAALLARLVALHKPSVLLFGATPLGRSLAPRLAARLGTGLTADCTQLEIDPDTGLLRQTRPAFGGNLMATIVCPDHRPQMATVRPGVFPAAPSPGAGTVKPAALPQGAVSRIAELARTAQGAGGGLPSAQLIVSVGRGIGVRKNLALVHRLAQLLGAQVGCSRPLVESGWMAYAHQIGQTGCSVSPKVLLAFGISGAIQHLAGLGGAQCIVAVNSDPEAPIFRQAHYQVVADCREVLGELISKLEAR